MLDGFLHALENPRAHEVHALPELIFQFPFAKFIVSTSTKTGAAASA